MTHLPKRRKGGRLLLVGAILLTTAVAASGQQRTFKAGSIILFCQPGTPLARVNALADKVKGTLKPLLMDNLYEIVLPVNKMTDMDTLNAVAALKLEANVRNVTTNWIDKIDQATKTPNDPRFSEEWHLRLMNVPQAWVLQKGAKDVNVAVMDSGFTPTHEDLEGQYLVPGSIDGEKPDIITNPDFSEIGVDTHGTHVSGIIVAKTNNSKGVAGICWENVKCVGIRAGNGAGGITGTAQMNGFAHIHKNYKEYHIVALNMSFGSQNGNPNDPNDARLVALKQLAEEDKIMLFASAGNSFPVSSVGHLPSGYAFVHSVGSVGPTSQKASYSQVGKVDIAATGGEQEAEGDPNGVLSTTRITAESPTFYTFFQGTSMSSPSATGVAALLMSVKGMTSDRAWEVMKATAKKNNIPGPYPNPAYGHGIVDAYAALARVTANVIIQSPLGVDSQGNISDASGITPPVESLKPLLRFKVGLIPLDGLTVRISGPGETTVTYAKAFLQDHIESGNATGDNPQYTISFYHEFKTTGQKDITISAPDPSTGEPLTDFRRITIVPKEIQGTDIVGTDNVRRKLAMISIPYFEEKGPTEAPGEYKKTLLGTDSTLYRFIYRANGATFQGNYAGNGPAATSDPLGSYADLITRTPSGLADLPASAPDAGISDIRPVGSAFFIDLPAGTRSILTKGRDFSKSVVRIPVREGWNMIGDPYPFPVSFNTVLVEQADGTRLPVQQAVDQGLLLPYVYRYVGNDYEYATLPNGQLLPWEGHWVYIKPLPGQALNATRTLTLLFSPTPASRSRGAVSGGSLANVPPVSGAGSWRLQLEARTRNLHDSFNFIGVSNGSGNAGRTRAPKPPKPGPYVSLGIVGKDPGLEGLFAHDFQTPGGTKTWEVAVSTNQLDTDINLAWPAINTLPRDYRLVLTDKVTGQTVDMRQKGTYQFNSGRNAATRTFVVTARPGRSRGRALVTNIAVNPSTTRSGQSRYEINYTVSEETSVHISVLSFGGRVLSELSGGVTRAATVGENRVVWDGRDKGGRDLPAGTYVLQVRAVTPEGDVTREVRPFLITGR